MECVDLQVIRRQHSALMHAQRLWEADATQGPALRTALRATQAQLDAWEEAGIYVGGQGRLLANHVATLEALMTLRAQAQKRG